ncbi:hypothetical protein CFC21_080237 [Triticum aestivum]|uniref:Uncharacterized protein n=2 Tax=Triticum aestivum TaxID=4565 RepID=A0A3B6MZU5_WHEAT|nr:hypothetical protein CFC21_080237 [Triticum aestivum]
MRPRRCHLRPLRSSRSPPVTRSPSCPCRPGPPSSSLAPACAAPLAPRQSMQALPRRPRHPSILRLCGAQALAAASWPSPSRWRVHSSRAAAALALADGAYNGVAPGHLRGGSSSRTSAAGGLLRPVSLRWGISAGLRCGFGIEVTQELLDLSISSSGSPLFNRLDQVGAALRGHMYALGI